MMPSRSHLRWTTVGQKELDEIEQAHTAVGGTGRGRRYATQQINHAYAVLLASQFQRFCRDLHSECVDHLISAIATSTLIRSIVGSELTRDRKLDRGNANPGNLGDDFKRLGIEKFWDTVQSLDPRNQKRQKLLNALNEWRNAIAHQNFNPVKLGPAFQLDQVKRWRRACRQLARSFDEVTRNHLQTLTGTSPW
jgi:hypothetical protein